MSLTERKGCGWRRGPALRVTQQGLRAAPQPWTLLSAPELRKWLARPASGREPDSVGLRALQCGGWNRCDVGQEGFEGLSGSSVEHGAGQGWVLRRPLGSAPLAFLDGGAAQTAVSGHAVLWAAAGLCPAVTSCHSTRSPGSVARPWQPSRRAEQPWLADTFSPSGAVWHPPWALCMFLPDSSLQASFCSPPKQRWPWHCPLRSPQN